MNRGVCLVHEAVVPENDARGDIGVTPISPPMNRLLSIVMPPPTALRELRQLSLEILALAPAAQVRAAQIAAEIKCLGNEAGGSP
jgi:hypothetical protein